MKGMIVIKVQKCIGCKSCELACAVAHSESKDLYEAVSGSEQSASRIKVAKSGEFDVPLKCRHCANAPCMKVCPVEAVSRVGEDGPVVVDVEKCTGCELCVLACPFGAIRIGPDGKVALKCDQCYERLEQGLMPACVDACSTNALVYRTADQMEAEKDGDGVHNVLATYLIDPENCTGCTACARKCPVGAISGEKKEVHVIDQSTCIKSGLCLEVCKYDAVRID